MSFLQRAFGRKPKKPTLPQAIQKLATTEEDLQKRAAHLEQQIKAQEDIMKVKAKTDKKVALQALQRKKRLQRQLQQVDGALTTLEAQKDVLQKANTNVVAVDSMDTAAKALKGVHKKLNVDQVEKIVEDLNVGRDQVEEIADALSHPVGFSDEEFDEEELERELEELTADWGKAPPRLEPERKDGAKVPPRLEPEPKVPNESPQKEEKKKKKRAPEVVMAS